MKNWVLDARRELHSALAPHLGTPAILLDAPAHFNPGDQAILLGELEYFSKHGQLLRSIHSRYSRRIPDSDLFFVHGGGNLGDLYPKHTEHKLILAKRFPDSKFVHLPQSMEWRDLQARERFFASLEGEHVFLVRDRRSLQEVKDCGHAGQITPDMAVSLSLARPMATKPIQRLIRNDVESTGSTPGSRDWLTRGELGATTMADHYGRIFKESLGKVVPESKIYNLGAAIVTKNVSTLFDCEFLETNRLHGSILAALMGLPCRALDNKYGKVSRYWNSQRSKPRNLVVEAAH